LPPTLASLPPPRPFSDLARAASEGDFGTLPALADAQFLGQQPAV
jgi:hypothetical protein